MPGPVCLQGAGVCARGLNGPVRARPVGLSLGRGDTPHNPAALGRQSPTPLGEGDRRSVFVSLGADGVAKWDAGLALPTAGVRLARSPALGHVHGPIDDSDAEARLGPCVGAVHPTHPALNGQGPWALGGICVRNFGAPGMSTGVPGGGMAAPPGLRAEVAAGLYLGFSSANSASAGHGPCAQGTRGISGGAVSLKGDTRKEGASSRALLWADGGCPLQRQLRLRRAELRREEAAARMQAAARGFLARREVAHKLRGGPQTKPLRLAAHGRHLHRRFACVPPWLGLQPPVAKRGVRLWCSWACGLRLRVVRRACGFGSLFPAGRTGGAGA